MWTDSESAWHKIQRSPDKKSLLDSRVSRLLGWLWTNFSLNDRLKINFIPSERNQIANKLSRIKNEDINVCNEINWTKDVKIESFQMLMGIIEDISKQCMH